MSPDPAEAAPAEAPPIEASPIEALPVERADVVLAGGGLANSLIALRLKARRPDLRVVMLDRRAPGAVDPHTWSLFATDVAAEVWAWLAPLAAHRWDGYAVRFPAHTRTLSTPYASVTGAGLAARVAEALGGDLRLGVEVARLEPGGAVAADGRLFTAPLVIDGRGARPSDHLSLAWQKFVGLELRLAAPHGLVRPVVMDATVAQRDGYRFLYLLPFAPDVLLVEDTRYSAAGELDAARVEADALAYARAQGWTLAEVLRREQGVLPIVLGGDIEAYLAEADTGAAVSGLRAALFHPVTGYSLPQAAAFADAVAALPVLDTAAVRALARARARRLWREGGFLRALNRMLFLAAEPERRYRVLERFYRLPQPLIERFYAGRLSGLDQARILAGRPPVAMGRALKALPERAAFR